MEGGCGTGCKPCPRFTHVFTSHMVVIVHPKILENVSGKGRCPRPAVDPRYHGGQIDCKLVTREATWREKLRSSSNLSCTSAPWEGIFTNTYGDCRKCDVKLLPVPYCMCCTDEQRAWSGVIKYCPKRELLEEMHPLKVQQV